MVSLGGIWDSVVNTDLGAKIQEWFKDADLAKHIPNPDDISKVPFVGDRYISTGNFTAAADPALRLTPPSAAALRLQQTAFDNARALMEEPDWWKKLGVLKDNLFENRADGKKGVDVAREAFMEAPAKGDFFHWVPGYIKRPIEVVKNIVTWPARKVGSIIGWGA